MWIYSPAQQKQYCKPQQKSLAALAQATGWSNAANIERGNLPSMATYLPISNAHNLAPKVFFKQNEPIAAMGKKIRARAQVENLSANGRASGA